VPIRGCKSIWQEAQPEAGWTLLPCLELHYTAPSLSQPPLVAKSKRTTSGAIERHLDLQSPGRLTVAASGFALHLSIAAASHWMLGYL